MVMEKALVEKLVGRTVRATKYGVVVIVHAYNEYQDEKWIPYLIIRRKWSRRLYKCGLEDIFSEMNTANTGAQFRWKPPR